MTGSTSDEIKQTFGVHFQDMKYKRVDLEAHKTAFQEQLQRFAAAENAVEANDIIQEIQVLRKQAGTQHNLAYIRHSLNTEDKFYDEENNYYDQIAPSLEELDTHYYKQLVSSPFRKELEQKWGTQLFQLAEMSLLCFAPEIMPFMAEENTLSSAYMKLKATAQFTVEGERHSLSTILRLETAPDREIRRKAANAKWDFYASKSQEIESIFEQQVKARQTMAQALGFSNYTPLAYSRLMRTDYKAEQVAGFRKQIQEHVVPIATELYERQRQRLKIDTLNYYDEEFKYPSGNPSPKGNPEWIVEQAKTMYRNLSPETETFFQFMISNHLLDVQARPGKSTGGYCTFIEGYESPFIFSNFNGTSADIDVLTHEAGHAFQVFSSRHLGISEYLWPTREACEIHSMSMEFFTWPWMDLFFGEETNKYYFAHLSNALLFLPYGCAVDEFQHLVYENPQWSNDDRNKAWLEIEKKYLPHRQYDGNAFLEKGGFWQKQNHIFANPFYYIDYVLAGICALQFWAKNQEDHGSAWNDYLRLCQVGGSMPFTELVAYANLRSPFENGCVEEVVKHIKVWLDRVDDSAY